MLYATRIEVSFMKSILVKVLLGLWLGMQCSISFSMELVPCWLNNPVTENQIGFIGAANPFSSKINGSLIDITSVHP